MSITGIILAGGKSSRIGSDKGLLELNGRKLVEIAIGNLSKLCGRILISANSEAYSHLGYEVIPDSYRDIGPMGGIYSTLSKSTTEYNLVLSVDLPFVNFGLLQYLTEKVLGYDAAVPWSGNEHYEPLCACYNRSILPRMEEYIGKGNFKLPDLFSVIRLNPLIIDEQLLFFESSLFFNLNTMDDLASAKNMINSSKKS
jgi:molybdenum cofactor guanylyltransferase